LKVYVIHGSPLSGKSTYVNNNKGSNDLIYDFDLIMSAISGRDTHDHNDNLLGYVKDIRDLIVIKLKSEKNIDTAWIITTRVTEELNESLVGLNPIYKEIKIDTREAQKRLKHNPGNRNIKDWTEAISKYFNSIKDYSGFYGSSAWQRKREIVLKKVNYECGHDKRFGIRSLANTVHHVIPLTERPDLRLNDKNLIALSHDNHSKMHKPDGTLSKLGKELKERTLRKYPELVDK